MMCRIGETILNGQKKRDSMTMKNDCLVKFDQ